MWSNYKTKQIFEIKVKYMGLARGSQGTLKINGNVHFFKPGVRFMGCSLHFYSSYLMHSFF